MIALRERRICAASDVFSIVSVALLAVCQGLVRAEGEPILSLSKGDRICFIGNTLAERMQHFGFFESRLHARFPGHELVVRNQAFSADEVGLRPRSLGFGDPHQHLAKEKADVVLAFFGFNESFAGREGLPAFREKLRTFIDGTKGRDYGGKGQSKLVLFTPIAYENLDDSSLPPADRMNDQLSVYAQAMTEVAQAADVPCVDLFHPTLQLLGGAASLTFNGVHLTEKGYEELALLLDGLLFGEEGRKDHVDHNLRSEVNAKNFEYFHRYRAVSGYYIHGDRSQLSFEPDPSITNAMVMERERQILDEICALRDRRIWAVARGESVPDTLDASGISRPIDVASNFEIGEKKGSQGALAYLSPEASGERMRPAAGYAVNVFASEADFPEIANCVEMAFDAKGRLWVCCMPMYQGRRPGEPLSDKIVVLEDSDGDGTADTSTIFADDLHLPTGIELGDGGVYVAQQPDLLFLQDTDGDGRADKRERILHGFDSADPHHAISTFTWGPGGALYFQEGTFHHTSVETPYGPVRNAHGGVYRYEPGRKKLETFVNYNFNNPWGHAFDRWGQDVIADASDGSNYFAAAFSGRPVPYMGQPDFGPFLYTYRAKLKTFLPKRVRPTAGCVFVSSDHFPPQAQGRFLLANCVGFHGVLQHDVYEDDSGIRAVEIEPLLQSSDPNFRPIDIEFGPDGALYVVDWHHALVGHMHHNVRDPSRDNRYGRIWRITYPSRPLSRPSRIEGESIENLVPLLAHPVAHVRHQVRMALRRHPTKEVTQALDEWIDRHPSGDPEREHHLLESLWVRQHHGAVDRKALDQVLASPDPRARAAAVRVASQSLDALDNPLTLFRTTIRDRHPRVRLETVRALSFLQTADAASVALEVLDHPMDDYLRYVLVETFRVLEPFLVTLDDDGDERPLIFLDRNRRQVDYQLGRLSNDELLRSEHDVTHTRYLPVYEAIIDRPDMPAAEREEAVAAASSIRGTDIAAEWIAALGRADERRAEQATLEVGRPLLTVAPRNFRNHRASLESLAAHAKTAATRHMAHAVLLQAGFLEASWRIAEEERVQGGVEDWLAGLAMVPSAEIAGSLTDRVLALTESGTADEQAAAIRSAASLAGQESRVFPRLAALLPVESHFPETVHALLRVPPSAWKIEQVPVLAETLITRLKTIPEAERNGEGFLNAFQLGLKLADQLPESERSRFRSELDELKVTAVHLGTLPLQLKFDKEELQATAGKPLEIQFENSDTVPHNLVVARPGSLEELGRLADQMAADPEGLAKHFVPESQSILAASRLLQAGERETLRLSVPDEPGDYVFLCTYPGHWRLMHGKLVVK